jgi:hypothetical protein
MGVCWWKGRESKLMVEAVVGECGCVWHAPVFPRVTCPATPEHMATTAKRAVHMMSVCIGPTHRVHPLRQPVAECK